MKSDRYDSYVPILCQGSAPAKLRRMSFVHHFSGLNASYRRPPTALDVSDNWCNQLVINNIMDK